MAKVTAYIPEPAPEYEAENQRQIIEALATMQQQLNFSFQQYFIKIKVLNKPVLVRLPCLLALQMGQL